MSTLPMAVYGLEIPAGDIAIPAKPDIPAAVSYYPTHPLAPAPFCAGDRKYVRILNNRIDHQPVPHHYGRY